MLHSTLRWRRLWSALAAVAAVLLSLGAAGAQAQAPVFHEVSGSPFEAGTSTELSSFAVAFDPDEKFLAAISRNHEGFGVDATMEYSITIFKVAPNGTLTRIAHEPYTPAVEAPHALAFSPNGRFLAVGSAESPDEVSVYEIDQTSGELTSVEGSPFATEALPRYLAFSPDGTMLAIAGSSRVEVLEVNQAGELTENPGRAFNGTNEAGSVAWSSSGEFLETTDKEANQLFILKLAGGRLEEVREYAANRPLAAAFSPTASLLAYAEPGELAAFSFDSGGALTAAPQSPFDIEASAEGLAFTGDGTLLAAFNTEGKDVSVLSVSPQGELANVAGSPYQSGAGFADGPSAVAFTPRGGLMATANSDPQEEEAPGSVRVYALAPPTATIASPAENATFTQNELAAASFECAEAPFGPGISTYEGQQAEHGCEGSGGGFVTTSESKGVEQLETKTLGEHAFSVTARSFDGQTATATLNYDVVQASSVESSTVHLTVSPEYVDARDDGHGVATSDAPVDVGVKVTSSGGGTPTGSVTLLNGAGIPLDTLTLENGEASATLTSLSPDGGPLKAEYGGPHGSSATAPLRVGFDPTSISLEALPALTANSALDLTGTITAQDPGDAAPSGTVTLHEGAGGPVLGSTTLAGGAAGEAERFGIELEKGVSAGTHAFVVEFANAENRYAASSAEEGVTASAPASCEVVAAIATTAATRVDGSLSYASVPVTVTPETDACKFGSAEGVTPGGRVELTAQPPAYEKVSAFTVHTQDGGTSTLPVEGSPGAAQAASAELTIAGPTSVAPVPVEVPGSCPTLGTGAHWRGATEAREDLASFTVTGEVGCTVAAAVQTETIPAGGEVPALAGTPLTVSPDSAEISKAAGLDYVTAVEGTPPGASGDGLKTSFALQAGTKLTAVAQMVCTALPKLVQATGGTASLVGEPTIAEAGAMSAVLSPTGSEAGYTASCPAAWGSGVVPGAKLTYAADPLSYDKELGFPEGDPRSTFGVQGFHEVEGTEDSKAAVAAEGLEATLTPDLIGTKVTSQQVKDTITEPRGFGAAEESVHPLAVGFRYERLACVTVKTEASSAGPDQGGVKVLGEQQDGTAISSSAAPQGQLSIETPSNCPAVGPGYYKPGTAIKFKATDPAGLGGLTVTTEEQHPGEYNGTTEPDYFAAGSASADSVAAVAARLGSSSGTSPQGTLPSLLTSLPSHSLARSATAARAKRTGSTHAAKHGSSGGRHRPAPVDRVPSYTPAAAPRVPDVAAARKLALATIAGGDAAIIRSEARAARLGRVESAARRRVEALQRDGSKAALVAASHRWGTATVAWWRAEEKVIRARGAADETAMKQLVALAKARFGAGDGSLRDGSLRIVGERIRIQLTRAAIAAAHRHVVRVAQLSSATRAAVAHGASKTVRHELPGIERMAHDLRAYASTGPAELRGYTASLAKLAASASRSEQAGAAAQFDLLARAAQRATLLGRRRSKDSHESTRRRRTHTTGRRGGTHANGLEIARTAAAEAGQRPLFGDETREGANVRMPLAYQGIYAEDAEDQLVQSSGSHEATFTVGTSPMTVRATWGPSSCERPSIEAESSKVTVGVEGGEGQCNGPGTVARMGTFVVDANAEGAAIPVMTVQGTAPDGTVQKRIQAGSSASFPALRNSSVHVELCEPLEFGGDVRDTVNGGSQELEGAELEQFATVVPGTGRQCAIPGFFTVGSQVRFAIPSFLSRDLSPRTVTNPALTNAPYGDGKNTPAGCEFPATASSNVAHECAYGSGCEEMGAGACNERVPAAGSAAWEVDGEPVGSAPTVTLDEAEPQHAVGLQVAVRCDRLSLETKTWTYPSPSLEPGDCPLVYEDEGTVVHQEGESNTLSQSVGYYLAGDVPRMYTTTLCEDANTWENLSLYQPGYAPVNLNGYKTGPAGTLLANFDESGLSADTTTKDEVTLQQCGGYQHFAHEEWPEWNIPTFEEVAGSASEGIYSFATEVGEKYIAPLAEEFYTQLKTTFTTDPFTSLENFEAFGKGFGLLAATAVDPQIGELLLGAAASGDLENPTKFADYLGEVGRFLAASGIQVSFTVAQTFAVSGAVQLALSIGDAALKEISSQLENIGAPTALVKTIRAARVITNGVNAIKNCTTEAAAGNLPSAYKPPTAAATAGKSLGKAILSTLRGSSLGDPPPLAKALVASSGRTLSEAGDILSDNLSESVSKSKVGSALAVLSVIHNFEGANYNWSAEDYENCLAAETVG